MKAQCRTRNRPHSRVQPDAGRQEKGHTAESVRVEEWEVSPRIIERGPVQGEPLPGDPAAGRIHSARRPITNMGRNSAAPPPAAAAPLGHGARHIHAGGDQLRGLSVDGRFAA